ncbi:PLP-dependent aminotransferase family protein [Burkholderiaceae bacterium FT117]|uniref:aminotransferase-like domain-containing protein n=1 Tax=Zeimonas sediminis TaxID=2944268 RepID=UPI00234323B9|nr:PLP-dependent aminotransferase family protein [Zeimonas sediminis]MCM5572303.1 PLP-dependent aminotransferase family protein [Zeimonas sediminis]
MDRANPDDPRKLLARRAGAMRSSAVRDLLHDARRPGMLSLAGGLPAPDLFDVDGLAEAAGAVLREVPREALQYGTTEGDEALRAQLAASLRARGASVSDDAPLVTTGSQQALDLIARALLEPGDRVVVERPGYLAALQVFALTEARCVGVAGDARGLRVEALPEAAGLGGKEQGGPAGGRLKLAYAVTNFANPTGATLDLDRRIALLEWAVRNRVFVLEDDPYGGLRVEGEHLPPLVALAPRVPGAAGLCGYVSSLSKVLAPGLRIGYAVLPDWLRGPVVRIKQALDLHTSTLAQAIAARYLASGRLEARMPAMREAYRERRDALCEALAQAFGPALRFSRPQGGMFVWARFTDGTDTSRLLPRARDEGMIFVPGEAFYDAEPDRSALRLSFSTATPAELAEAVARLARAHRALRGQAATGAEATGANPGASPRGSSAAASTRSTGAADSNAAAATAGDPSQPGPSGPRGDRVREACLAAALEAWEDAGMRGLCAEGRWEVAIGAIRSLDLDTLDRQD